MRRSIPYGFHSIVEKDIDAVVEVLRSDRLTQGPAVERFEEALADRCGARYAVAVSSGTAALHLACLAAGVGPGDEVIAPALTFVASANCAVYCGAIPVLADVDADTGCLSASEVLDKASPRTRAVIAVHYAGHPCDMDEVSEAARACGGAVIEDACHALGASYREHAIGSCSHSDMTVFSFHPVKHITTGEGGAILTNDAGLASRLRSLRSHGITKDPTLMEALDPDRDGGWYYEMHDLGYNYRITDIQCALGMSQLERLDEFVERRRRVKSIYDGAFAGLKGVTLPVEAPWATSSWHLYPLRVPVARRKAFFEGLREASILAQVHYMPVHLHPYYRHAYGYAAGDLPRAEAYYDREVSLPLFPGLSDDDVEYVASVVCSLLAGDAR